jgi:hypothetical protein
MSLLGIIAVRKRSANIPQGQIEKVADKLGVPVSIVDSDDDHGVQFCEIHNPSSSSDIWIKTGIAVLIALEFIRIMFH